MLAEGRATIEIAVNVQNKQFFVGDVSIKAGGGIVEPDINFCQSHCFRVLGLFFPMGTTLTFKSLIQLGMQCGSGKIYGDRFSNSNATWKKY